MASRVPLSGIRAKIMGDTPVNSISVTNFAASVCEIKALYQKMKISGNQISTASQKSLDFGTKTHEKLDDMVKKDIQTPKAATISGFFPAALKLLDTASRWRKLAISGSCREIPLYGNYKGIKIYGIADGFENNFDDLTPGKYLRIVENKTTMARLPPQDYKMRLAYHQALMYRFMFNQMMTRGFDVKEYITLSGASPYEPLIQPGEEDAEFLEQNPDFEHEFLELQIPFAHLNLETVYGVVDEEFKHLRRTVKKQGWKLDNKVSLRYTNRRETAAYELECDNETEQQLLEHCGELWLGQREPSPFRSDGNLTCNWCQFTDICEFAHRANEMGVPIK